ncbi:MAG: glycosyltransferase [Acidobacteria bacterium]|nr:glycosyltransferase [Acidobacteriota bacterium]
MAERSSRPRRDSGPRILVPSIGNPVRCVNGASTYTRELERWLRAPPLEAEVCCLSLPTLRPVRHRLRQSFSLARSLFSKLPAKAIFARSRRMSVAVSRELRDGGYDLVVLNGTDLLWLLDELPDSLPVVVVAHNIEHRLFDVQVRSAEWLPTPFRKHLRGDALRLARYELDGMKRAGNVVALSAEDAVYVERHCGGLQTLVLPPAFGYNPHPRRPPAGDSEPLEIGFVGNFGWWPNQQGLDWFLKRVFAHLDGGVRLHLFGEQSDKGALPDGVVAHGYVPDLGEVLEQCHFMICPILGGGGVSIKAAEAIYNRVPILATPFGVRGLPLAENPAIVVRETPQDWVQFLGSAGARELAARSVLEINSGRFRQETRREALQSYVLRVMGRDKN